MKRYLISIAALLMSLSMTAQSGRMAVVDLSSVYMRQKPDYESALETQELMGTVVEIVGESGYWREIRSPQPYRAWVTEKGLVEMSEQELEAYVAAPKVMFTGLYGHVRKSPSSKSGTICDLVGGDVLRLSGKPSRGRWTGVVLPSGISGYVLSENLKSHGDCLYIGMGEGSGEDVPSEVSERIIAYAESLLGSPYLWGGMTAKGVDCSGLVRISHIVNGIYLPRNASQQIQCGKRVDVTYDRVFWDEAARTGRPGDFKEEMLYRMKNLRRGDLVFFGTPSPDPQKKDRITHVGIYLGDGYIIHSSHKVRINSMIPGDSDFYENSHRFLAAVRL